MRVGQLLPHSALCAPARAWYGQKADHYVPLMSDGVLGITVLLSVSPFHNALAFMPLLQLVADY